MRYNYYDRKLRGRPIPRFEIVGLTVPLETGLCTTNVGVPIINRLHFDSHKYVTKQKKKFICLDLNHSSTKLASSLLCIEGRRVVVLVEQSK